MRQAEVGVFGGSGFYSFLDGAREVKGTIRLGRDGSPERAYAATNEKAHS